jgi:predicted  nucleic acid-binding Zn-ribbon protein
MTDQLKKALTEFGEAFEELKKSLSKFGKHKRDVEKTEELIRKRKAEREKLIDKINDRKDPPTPEEKEQFRRKINEIEAELKGLGPILEQLKEQRDEAGDWVKVHQKALAEKMRKLLKEIGKLLKD